MHSDRPQHRLRDIALFGGLALLHAALLLLGFHSTIMVSAHNEIEALQLMSPPPPQSAPVNGGAVHTGAVHTGAVHTGAALAGASHAATAPTTSSRYRQRSGNQPPAEETPGESFRLIDWTLEAQNTARRQAELAASSAPRPLNDRERHGVPGGKPATPAPEFGWDRVHAGRVQASDGALFIRLNDRCTIVLMPLPFFGCGIGGEIIVRGDLFDHMRDAPMLDTPPSVAP